MAIITGCIAGIFVFLIYIWFALINIHDELDEMARSLSHRKNSYVGTIINAGNAPIYTYAGDKDGRHQYFSKEPYYYIEKERNGYLLARWYKNHDGYTGWFKQSDIERFQGM